MCLQVRMVFVAFIKIQFSVVIISYIWIYALYIYYIKHIKDKVVSTRSIISQEREAKVRIGSESMLCVYAQTHTKGALVLLLY